MRKASHRDANHYRERAEECRTIADHLLDGDARTTMLRVATDYERMADSVDQIAGFIGELDELTPLRARGRKFQ